MSWGVCRKSAELGGRVVTLSGPDGYIYDPDGVTTQEKFDFMLSMRASGADKVEPYAEKFGVEFFPGKEALGGPRGHRHPLAPRRTRSTWRNAVMLVGINVRYYVEAANMPATIRGSASPAAESQDPHPRAPRPRGSGGVVVSALEDGPEQPALQLDPPGGGQPPAEDHGRDLRRPPPAAAEEYGLGYDLIAGNDIAAFKKISAAMIAQGL